MQPLYLFLIILIGPLFVDYAFAQQVVTVNQTTACFLNYSAGIDLWENCGLDEDYIVFAYSIVSLSRDFPIICPSNGWRNVWYIDLVHLHQANQGILITI